MQIYRGVFTTHQFLRAVVHMNAAKMATLCSVTVLLGYPAYPLKEWLIPPKLTNLDGVGVCED
jgi:hypothetical protein